MKHTYCKPYCADNPSSLSGTGNRLGRLLDSLQDEINANICEGQIRDDVYNFKLHLMDKLRADGWDIKVPKNNYKVRSLNGDPF